MEPISETAVETSDNPDKDRGIARYTSTNQLLTLYTEKGESRVMLVRMGTAWDFSIGVMSAEMAIEISWNKPLYLPVTDVRHLLTRRDCRDQTEHNDFGVWEGRSSAIFVLVSRFRA